MFMIRDHGPDFTAAFDAVLGDAGIQTMRMQHPDAPAALLPARSPL
jgi:hypothetical protein